MNKKKLLTFLLSGALSVSALCGVTACGGGDETSVTLLENPHQGAYAAYKKDGSQLGTYRSVADAVSAAVKNDAQTEQIGSYVTKTGSAKKIFINRQGYENKPGGNDDMYWFYDKGTSLDFMDCWDDTKTLERIWNNELICYRVSNYGTTAAQSWNGFKVYDTYGELIGKNEAQMHAYELSAPMDASVLAFTERETRIGVTKMEYTLDLSNVKITPTYKDTDSVYAFLGFYTWQEYYVVVTGIACNVTTGEWYPFEATSRDDSFHDANYDISKTRVMTSTWHEGTNGGSGYFTPDSTSLKLSIQTLTEHDAELDEDYQVNKLTVTPSGGENGKEYVREMTTEDINALSSAEMRYAQAYAFCAGLDIRNEKADSKSVLPVNYFNGAAFENLKVTAATAYFPTEEEMDDVKFGYDTIDPNRRGKTYNILMANDDNKDPDIMDYNIMQTAAFAKYTKDAENNCDIYSFDYRGNPVSENEFGTAISAYQSAIDSLIGVTQQNVVEHLETIEDIGKLYNDPESARGYYQFLDFKPYLDAQNLLQQAMTLTADGQAVVTAYNKLSDILKYTYKGWSTTETDIAGYLYSELEEFRKVKTAFNALTAQDDKDHIFFHIPKDAWETWVKLDTQVAAMQANEKFAAACTMSLGATPTTAAKDWKVMESNQALFEDMLLWAFRIQAQTDWTTIKGSNDSANGTWAGKGMSWDSCFYPALRVSLEVTYLTELGVELPEYVTDLLESINFAEFYDTIGMVMGTARAAYQIKEGTWADDKALESILNTYWGPEYEMVADDANGNGIKWNWESGAKFETYLSARATYLISCTPYEIKDYKFKDYAADVADFLTSLGFTIKANDWGITEGTIDLSSNKTAASDAVAAKINALSKLDGTYAMKGWATDGAEHAGYYYNELQDTKAAMDAYAALSVQEQIAAIAALTDKANWMAWQDEYNAMSALLENEAFAENATTTYNVMNNGYTGANVNAFAILKTTVYYMSAIWSKGNVADMDNTWENSCVLASRLVALKAIDDELELTPYLKAGLEAIKAYEFMENAYLPVVESARLAKSLSELQPAQGETAVKMSQLTEEQIAILNKYFNAKYELKAPLAVQWNGNGNQFAAWVSGRVAEVSKFALGGTHLAGQAEAEKKDGYYILYITKFLTDRGYTANANGWGVIANQIVAVDFTAETMAALNAINGVGEIGSSSYAGKVSEDIVKYRAFIALYNALSEDNKKQVQNLYSQDYMDAWTAFDEGYAKLEKNANWNTEVTFQRNAEKTKITTTVKGVVDEWYLSSLAMLNSRKYASFGAGCGTLNTDKNWMLSFHICYLVNLLADYDIDLKEIDEFEVTLLGMGYYSDAAGTALGDIAKDVAWLYNVLNLAKEIANSEEPVFTLTEEQVAAVNTYMVGWTHFEDNGLSWALANSDKQTDFVAWAKSADYKRYFGFTTSDTLASIVAKVTDILVKPVENFGYGAELTGYNDSGFDAKYVYENVKFGVKEAIEYHAAPSIEDFSQAAQAVIAPFEAFSDLAKYDMKGWAVADQNTPVKGYIYSELEAFRNWSTTVYTPATDAVKAEFDSYLELFAQGAKYEAWKTLDKELAALMADTKYTTAQPKDMLAGNGQTTIASTTAEKALKQVFYWSVTIKNKESKGMSIDSDNYSNSAVYLAACASYLIDDLKLTLPSYITGILEDINYAGYKSDVYDLFMGATKLVAKIHANEYTNLVSLDDADLAFLNKYFISGYQLGQLKWNWNSGHRLFDYYRGRAGYIVSYAYGFNVPAYVPATDTVNCGKNNPAANYGYFIITDLTQFLVKNGYTANENEWGVTVKEIVAIELSAEEQAVIALYTCSDLTKGYTPKGWTAPENTAVAGYLYSEVLAYRAFETEFAKLTDASKETVTSILGESKLNAWKVFDAEIKKIEAIANWDSLKIQLKKNTHSAQNASGGWDPVYADVDLTIGDSIIDLWKVLIKISNKDETGFDDDSSGKSAYMATDNNWIISSYACTMIECLYETGVDVTVLMKAPLTAAGYLTEDGDLTAFAADFRYLYNIIKLSGEIEDGKALTEAQVAVVNAFIAGKTRFAEGGFNWNANKGGIANRSGNSFVQMGFERTTNWYTCAIKVLNYLARYYDAEITINTTSPNAKTDGYIYEIGIRTEISVFYAQEPVDADKGYQNVLAPSTEGWTSREGAALPATSTVTKNADGSFTLATTGAGWASFLMPFDKTIKVENAVLCFNTTFEGTEVDGDSGNYYNIVIRWNDASGAAKYVYVTDVLKTITKHQLPKSGTLEIPVSELLTAMTASDKEPALAGSKTITLTDIEFYTYKGTVTVKEAYVISANGDLLPKTATGWTDRGGIALPATSKVTKNENGTFTLTNKGTGWASYLMPFNNELAIREGYSLFFDTKFEGTEVDGDSGNYYNIVIRWNDASGAAKYVYATDVLTTITKHQLPKICTLEIPLSELLAKMAEKEAALAGAKSISLTDIEFYAYKGTVTVNAVYVKKSQNVKSISNLYTTAGADGIINSDATPSTDDWKTANYNVGNGKTVSVQATFTGVTTVFHGFMVNLLVNNEWYRLRPDSCFYTFGSGATWENGKTFPNVTWSYTVGSFDTLNALIAKGTLTQVATATLSGNTLTIKIASYDATDTTLATVLAESTYTFTITGNAPAYINTEFFYDGAAVTCSNVTATFPTQYNVDKI